MKILITDDEEPIRELIKYNVEKSGFETVCAENAIQAVQFSRLEKPGLILLDLMLPDMSGLDVCRILKGDDSTRSIPIIMVTRHCDQHFIDSFLVFKTVVLQFNVVMVRSKEIFVF